MRKRFYFFVKKKFFKIEEVQTLTFFCLCFQILVFPSHIFLLFGKQKGYGYIYYDIPHDSIVLKQERTITIERLFNLMDKDLEEKLNEEQPIYKEVTES